MSLIDQLARIIFIRRGQYDLADDFTMTKCVFVPGSIWRNEYQAWYDMTESEKLEWINSAKVWLSLLEEKSPLTYSFLIANFRDGLVTKENLDTL